MMRLIFLFFIIPMITFSQIVNVEEKRQSDKNGISGFTKFTFDYKQAKKKDWELSNKSYIQWDNNSWSILLLNEINIDRADGIDFSNDGYQHLRISRHLNKKLSIEAFVQNQYDPIRSIKNRKLAGVGIRLNIHKKYDVGVSPFYENEILNDESKLSTLRLNMYSNIEIDINKNVLFQTTTYIQPNVNKVGDCKISNETSIKVKISKRFSLSNTFSGSYDTYPASEIPEFIYSIKNGLIYEF